MTPPGQVGKAYDWLVLLVIMTIGAIFFLLFAVVLFALPILIAIPFGVCVIGVLLFIAIRQPHGPGSG